MIIVLVGKSAVGKDTTMKELCKDYSYSPIISTTTRPMREGEQDGVQYHFTDKDTFQKLVDDGKFIEYVTFNENYYGSRLSDFDVNKKQVIVLDPSGARTLVDKLGRNNVFVVYMIASDDTRKVFTQRRGSYTDESWETRLTEDNKKFTDEALDDIVNFRVYVDYMTPSEVTDDIIGAVEEWHGAEKNPDEQYIVTLEDTTTNHYEEPPCYEYVIRTASYMKELKRVAEELAELEEQLFE